MRAGLSPCTELQWTRACDVDPSLGAIETATLTPDDGGFVVRGGGGCGRRTVVAGSDASPRPATCCSRAIAIESTNQNQSYLNTTSSKLAAFEGAIEHHDGSALRGLLDDSVWFYAKRGTNEQVASDLERMARAIDTWSLHEACALSLDVRADTWTADCRKVARRGAEVSYFVTRYVWSGRGGVVTSIAGLQVMRPFAPL